MTIDEMYKEMGKTCIEKGLGEEIPYWDIVDEDSDKSEKEDKKDIQKSEENCINYEKWL